MGRGSRLTAFALSVDTDEVKVLPHSRQEAFHKVELETSRDYYRVGSPGELVHLFDRELIDFVVHLHARCLPDVNLTCIVATAGGWYIETFHIMGAAHENVNELVHGSIAPQKHLSIVDFCKFQTQRLHCCNMRACVRAYCIHEG